ncbi:hypothetical protein [Arthrobacter sp. HLT1-21]
MTSIDLGASAEVTWPNAPAAGGVVALAVVQPDGTLLVPAPVPSDFKATFIPVLPGRHLIRWTNSGATVDAHTDVVDVWPQDPRFLFPPEQAAESLNWTAAAGDREDLRLYVAAATPVIEDIVGPMVISNEVHTAVGGGVIVLPSINATVTSVKVNGVQAPGFFAGADGILYAGSSRVRGAFPAGEIEVRFTLGMAVIPPNVQLAARELVRHMWQIGRQATGRSGRQDPSADAYTPSGFAVPRRVIELCAPHEQLGGFA